MITLYVYVHLNWKKSKEPLPGHRLHGLAVLVSRLDASPPAPVEGLGRGGGDAPEEGQQLHDSLLVGDDVERVELHADELQLLILIFVLAVSSVVGLQGGAVGAEGGIHIYDVCIEREGVAQQKKIVCVPL